MSYLSDSLGSIAYASPQPNVVMSDIERLELLVPELPPAKRDLQNYALAYAERYSGDLPQLEHEWELLNVALRQSWERADYGAAVRLAESLGHIAGRLDSPESAEQILQLGIAACQYTGDKEQMSLFLNRLGCLLFSHGKYKRGRRMWYASLQLASSGDPSSGLWEPLASFALTADVLGNYTEAHRLVETLLCTSTSERPDGLAMAVFVRGFYARLDGAIERAHADFSFCLRLLAGRSQPVCAATHSYSQLFSIAAQAELARIQGNYIRAQGYTDTAFSLAQLFGDCNTATDLLIDQMLFAYGQAQFSDTLAIFTRLRGLARRSRDPHFSAQCRRLEKRLAGSFPDPHALATASMPADEPLSQRELEVLELVASGHSTETIALLLVVTAGTVKKHLEHIYTKLGVHSRTSAVATARAMGILV